MTRITAVCACLAALVSCAGEPERYPPPLQRSLDGFVVVKPGTRAFVGMGDRDAELHIVSGVIRGPVEGVGRRWTYEHVELRYMLEKAEGWRFALDLALPEANFKQTGPVTITFRVNGHPLGSVRYREPGEYRFEKAVPAGWLTTSDFNLVTADVRPPYIAADDGARLGFLLYRAGFVAR